MITLSLYTGRWIKSITIAHILATEVKQNRNDSFPTGSSEHLNLFLSLGIIGMKL